jgi:hypothetical protein
MGFFLFFFLRLTTCDLRLATCLWWNDPWMMMSFFTNDICTAAAAAAALSLVCTSSGRGEDWRYTAAAVVAYLLACLFSSLLGGEGARLK